MAQVVVSHLVRNHKGNVLICGATFVEAPGKVDVAARSSKSGEKFEPRYFDDQRLLLRSDGLKTGFDPANAIDGPSLLLEVGCFRNLLVEPLSEGIILIDLEIRRHSKAR